MLIRPRSPIVSMSPTPPPPVVPAEIVRPSIAMGVEPEPRYRPPVIGRPPTDRPVQSPVHGTVAVAEASPPFPPGGAVETKGGAEPLPSPIAIPVRPQVSIERPNLSPDSPIALRAPLTPSRIPPAIRSNVASSPPARPDSGLVAWWRGGVDSASLVPRANPPRLINAEPRRPHDGGSWYVVGDRSPKRPAPPAIMASAEPQPPYPGLACWWPWSIVGVTTRPGVAATARQTVDPPSEPLLVQPAAWRAPIVSPLADPFGRPNLAAQASYEPFGGDAVWRRPATPTPALFGLPRRQQSASDDGVIAAILSPGWIWGRQPVEANLQALAVAPAMVMVEHRPDSGGVWWSANRVLAIPLVVPGRSTIVAASLPVNLWHRLVSIISRAPWGAPPPASTSFTLLGTVTTSRTLTGVADTSFDLLGIQTNSRTLSGEA